MSEDTALSAATRVATVAEAKKHVGHCAFCGRCQSDVKILVSGPSVFICNTCIQVCSEEVEKASKDGVDGITAGELFLSLPTEYLCFALASQDATLERVRDQMQATVNILRGRGVSWAVIGKALGVSRQAAWERFS